jgi:uncharacterized membrane protein
MTRWQSWSSHITTLLVSLSGVAYLWMKYFLETDDPFAIVNHPLQPSMLDVHLFTAPLLIFCFGLMFESHIRRKLKAGSRVNRKSGLIAAITFAVMTLSGYLLQITAVAAVSRAALVLHLLSSGIFLSAYVVHQVINFRLWRARVRQEPAKFVYEA